MYLFLETASANPSVMSIFLSNTLPFVLIIAVMYVMLISPQKKREKKITNMQNTLEIGDGVVTTGGIIGRVVSIKEDTIVVESASSKIRFKRNAIIEVEKLDAE
jgi:preprotein translocase subunit YajC